LQPESAAADVDGPRQTSRSTIGRFYFPASTASFRLQSMPSAVEFPLLYRSKIGGNVLNFGRIIGVIGAFWCILEADIVASP
jgi:hypothetical protein